MIDLAQLRDRPMRFSIIPSRAVFDPHLPNAALRVLNVLSIYSDGNAWCFRTSVLPHKAAIDQWIQTLVKLGYVDEYDDGYTIRYSDVEVSP